MQSSHAPRALALALVTSCAAAVAPVDPLIGVWRSDEFASTYPDAASPGQTVEEISIASDGTSTVTYTTRYPASSTPPNRYDGCTWTRVYPRVWTVDADAGPPILTFFMVPSERFFSERTGCADPTVNRARASYEEDTFFGLPFAGGRYAITEPTLTIEWGPVRGGRTMPRAYRRVR